MNVEQIILVVGNHPGATLEQIMKYLPFNAKHEEVQRTLNSLHTNNVQAKYSFFDSEFEKWSSDKEECDHYFLTAEGEDVFDEIAERNLY